MILLQLAIIINILYVYELCAR